MKEIPKIKLIPQTETEEAKQSVGYKWNKVAGTRHFLGGRPEEEHDHDYPKCNDCKEVMTFYAQIDSIGDNYALADCMVIHTYVCFNCFNVTSQLSQLKA